MESNSGLLKILKNPVDQFLASLTGAMIHGSHKTQRISGAIGEFPGHVGKFAAGHLDPAGAMVDEFTIFKPAVNEFVKIKIDFFARKDFILMLHN
ncbi:MAG: hypothetical protein U1F76_16370 [Candidatus Competibacteraceae bacterium]